MKIYTKTGDSGDTGLYRGGRVGKDSPRIAACGAVDELNSQIGALRTQGSPADSDVLLARVQNDLFVIGADLATPQSAVKDGDLVTQLPVSSERFLEEAIDRMESGLEPLRGFILPGGSPAGAAAHVARSVCRRAEREVVGLSRLQSVSPAVLVYLNRLSDFLFVLARHLNRISDVADVPWRHET